jgi:hypothetical protein
MTKKLARLLRADIQETSDLKSIAAMLAGKGRGGDTLLAHITPKEVGLLKEAGGAGTVNPDTGLLEFYDWTGTGGTVGGYDGGTSSYYTAPASSSYTAPTYTPYGYTSYTDLPEIDDLTAYQDTAGGFINKENLPRYTSEGLNLPVNIPVNTPQLANKLYEMPEVITSPTVSNIGLQSRGAGSEFLADGAGGARAGAARAGAGAGTPDKPFLTNEQMVRLGLSGGLGIYGALQQRKALEQIGKSTGQQKDIAKPYQDEGRKLTDAAQRGELTPAGVQQFQAVKAQLAQGAESRGGVGVAQAVAQAEAFKNQLLQGQYDYGLKVSQIGDNIALGAIRTGMQLDQQLGQANMAFYSQLGALAAGVPTYRT